ncbi:MAG TPA: bifunctional 2-C-methyl-D-erythritol 4-phosphate cytidylyltransferase/2-C-methyl-D-erythritol 2,4-cyclodiphosphate synthase, partial [Alphaproteobacteria bacterium]
QYLTLAGEPLLRRSVRAFAGHPAVEAVRVVIHPADRAIYDQAVADLAVLDPVAGGEARQDSVRNGLESFAAEPPHRVLIHDAARPLVGAATITRTLEALAEFAGAIAAVPVRDTLKRASGDDRLIAETVTRAGLWRAQTPQAFRFADILDAHRAHAGLDLTDDAQVAERHGLRVVLVEDSEDNLKVTTAADLVRAERLLAGVRTDQVRIGTGFDVHRFAADGDHVMLCGVKVPHARGLTGHSDADVGLHALVDAVLGALAAGDIGTHFPPGEERWKGADSAAFVEHGRRLAVAAGARIENVDITVICERPRIGPYRQAMRARVALLLGIDAGRVSIKATTTEGLGFAGRGEGIAAQAVASLRVGP